jgi:G2/mitotic-specific cyclin 2
MAPTAASRAKAGSGSTDIIKPDMAATKRKREALGEVPKASAAATANGKKGAAAATTATKGRKKEALAPAQLPSKEASGKGKEVFDGVVVKPTKSTVTAATTTTMTTAASRPATRTTTRRMVERTTVIKVPKDEPVPAKAEVKTVVHLDQPERQRVTRSSASRSAKGTVAAIARAHRQVQEEIEEEHQPVFKKLRTSSDMIEPEPEPEPAPEPVAEEEDVAAEDLPADDEAVHSLADGEADPNGPDWVDLDKEDSDDPVMVSEYVVEIFNYLKEVEVCGMWHLHSLFSLSEQSSTANDHAEPPLH